MPRPSTTQRGYGYLQQQGRERIRPLVEAGLVRCARCPKLIAPGETWELDHAAGKQGYLGPFHFKCNRSHGGRIGAAITNGTKRRVTREW
jgi:hypothetical protein